MGKWILWLGSLSMTTATILAAAYMHLHEPLRRDLEQARREASLCVQERATLSADIRDLEGLLADAKETSIELADGLTAREKQFEEMRSTEMDLVTELRSEIDEGSVQVERLHDQLKVDLVDEILFDAGETIVKPAGREILSRLAAVLQKTERPIQVQGHTDNVPIRGSLAELFPTNWEFSAARAVNVVRFLAEEDQLEADRLSATAVSEHQPRADNATGEGRAMNRRIEIIVGSSSPGDAPVDTEPVSPTLAGPTPTGPTLDRSGIE